MTRQQIGEGLLTIGSLGVLAGALMAIDWRAREQITLFVGDRPFGSIGSGAAWLYGAASSALDALRYQTLEHAGLTVFFAVALVLVFFMLRT